MYVYEMLGAELLSNLYDRLGRQLMDPQQSAIWQVKLLTNLTPIKTLCIVCHSFIKYCVVCKLQEIILTLR